MGRANRDRLAGTFPILVIAALVAVSCSFDYGDVGAKSEKELPTAVFTAFVHRVVDKGQLLLEMKSDYAESYTKSHRTELEGVTFTQYDSAGKVTATGRANSATVYTDTEDAEFRGDVKLQSTGEDSILEAENLAWNSDQKRLTSGLERIVSIKRGDGSRVRGAGFEADLRRRSFSFQEGTEGVFVTKDANAGSQDTKVEK
jgi:LPS export ABC transporter protein LptC